MSLLEEIMDYLIAEGVATAVGTDIFGGFAPANTLLGLAITETGGFEGERTHDVPGVAYERPTFQVRAWEKDYLAARAKARLAHDSLANVRNRMLSGVWYREITTLQSPFLILRDPETEVAFIGFNCRADKEPS